MGSADANDGGENSQHGSLAGSTSVVGSTSGGEAVQESGSVNTGIEGHSVTVLEPTIETEKANSENFAQGASWDQQPEDPGNSSDYDEEPLRFRNLNEVYDETSEVDLTSDSEFGALLAMMEEPSTYQEAAENVEWVAAMDSEIQSIAKMGHGNLQNYHLVISLLDLNGFIS